jgi:acyl-CoA reductase-like NAD-dependent aldehyde dehydrogenase
VTTDGSADVIQLPVLGTVAPQEQGEAMRDAVLQAIEDLFIKAVPPEERSPLFDSARDLLEQARRTPLEMIAATEPGPERDALFDDLRLPRR